MNLPLLLLWFPILLGVGVGGRLLGCARGYGLGLLCALFWLVLLRASVGSANWSDLWTVATFVAGAAAIVAMGGWAGQAGELGTRNAKETAHSALTVSPSREATSTLADDRVSEKGNASGSVPRADGSLERFASVLDQFDEWIEDHRHDNNPWPKFDEFIRSVLYECCQATHVKPYRLAGEGDELLPLTEFDLSLDACGGGVVEPLAAGQPLSARRGILGHVLTSGRCYYAGDATQGELVAKLAEEGHDDSGQPHSRSPVAWCFAIRQGTERLGVVSAGHLNIPPQRNKPLLRAVERLVGQLWCTLREVCHGRVAAQDDPVSGLYTREAFLRVAEDSLHESYKQGEPVAFVVIAIEQLRELNDSGRWEVADQLIREVGHVLRRKVRLDDRLGRFDGSRLLLLLRRVDSELATLIVDQVMSRLTALCGNQDRWRASISVRCGLAGSGAGQPDLKTLMTRALSQCRRARVEGAAIASDLAEVSMASS